MRVKEFVLSLKHNNKLRSEAMDVFPLSICHCVSSNTFLSKFYASVRIMPNRCPISFDIFDEGVAKV